MPTIRTAIIGLAGSGIFVRWYSSFGRQPTEALRAGHQLPGLSLRRLDGTSFNTQELRGAPAAIYFYRGNWCPFCTTQINDVVAHYQALTDRGIRIVMISPQPEHESRNLADRFDVDILWLTDPDLNAAQQLGITDPDGIPFGTPGDYGHDTVLPTLIVIDDDLTILDTHETDNFRQRPDASIVLTILDRNPQRSPAPRPQLPGALAR